MRARAGALTILAAAAMTTAGCTSVVRYGDGLVDAGTGRSLFTRLPATVGGTAGFVVGLPVDVLVFVPAWVYYQSLPRETRDPVSVFLFSSFVLWKVGVLFGAPFDAIEWSLWRSRSPATGMSDAQREAIEREWDARGAFPVYPVTPIVPGPGGPDGPGGATRP
ncbi:MAG: hypothetical protein ACK5AL_06700 [Planctomycetota bacterium]|jgi:hypothetical protein